MTKLSPAEFSELWVTRRMAWDAWYATENNTPESTETYSAAEAAEEMFWQGRAGLNSAEIDIARQLTNATYPTVI